MTDRVGPIVVSRETRARLDGYAALLRKWNPSINLVSRQSLADAEQRHFADSAQLWGLAPGPVAHWADLGSGGGFPGLVIAILAAEFRPDMRVTLVESDQRKAAFLAAAARGAGVAARVCAERIESTQALGADVISARALAPLPRLLDLALPHLAPGGRLLLSKGAQHATEVQEALAKHRFDVQNIPSITEPGAVILNIGGLAHV